MVDQVKQPMRVGNKTVSVNMGAGHNGGIRRGAAPPRGMVSGGPVRDADPGTHPVNPGVFNKSR